MMVRWRHAAVGLLTILSLSGCGTLAFRDVQQHFNDAVRMDNTQSVQGLGPLGALGGYDQVRIDLADPYPTRLDPRLQPTAYAMRSVAEWRTGRLPEARETARRGLALAETPRSPRDQLVMQLIEPVVLVEEIQGRFRRTGGARISAVTYQAEYRPDFQTAAIALQGVLAGAGPGVPDEVLYYGHFQQWRLLQQWRVVIASIAEPAEFSAAGADAARIVGAPTLADAVERERRAVPPGHPLRLAMDQLEK